MRRSRDRLAIAGLTGIATALAIPASVGGACRIVGGWDAAALVSNVLSWWVIARSDLDATRRHCVAVDPGRHAGWLVAVLASSVSLFATAMLLRDARAQAPDAKDLFTVLCAIAIANAWVLTHTSYALRYAHLYYREPKPGLVFPGDEEPSYFDFAYFAWTIGMTFQVSDVVIASPRLRRAVLPHAVLSFAYATAIVAAAVNVMIGVFS